MSKEITKEMLFNYFANKATSIQKRSIDEWAQNAANQEIFYDCLAQWENENLQYESDVDAALRRHRKRIGAIHAEHSSVEISGSAGRKRSFLKISIAASLLMAVLLAGYLMRDRIYYRAYATSYGETKAVSLNDGTNVILHSNSSLTLPRFGFGEFTRDVSLKGEASFSVAHLPGNQRFVVHTLDGNDITVLGTEFSVYTRMHRFKVALIKGKIQLHYKEDQNRKDLIMTPGDLVTIDPKGKAVSQKTPDPATAFAWKDDRYVFDNTTMKEICTLFKDDFGWDVEFADTEISEWAVSGSFKASNAQELLDALAGSSGLIYRKENQKIIVESISSRK